MSIDKRLYDKFNKFYKVYREKNNEKLIFLIEFSKICNYTSIINIKQLINTNKEEININNLIEIENSDDLYKIMDLSYLNLADCSGYYTEEYNKIKNWLLLHAEYLDAIKKLNWKPAKALLEPEIETPKCVGFNVLEYFIFKDLIDITFKPLCTKWQDFEEEIEFLTLKKIKETDEN